MTFWYSRQYLHELTKNGCTWANLPHDLPPYSTVYFYFQRWTKIGVIAEINHQISEQVRLADGREATPSLASLDSQSVKTMDSAGSRGIDGGKNVKGRKRFIMVDTLGLVFGALVCPANIGERAGAKRLLASLKYPLRRLQKILVDKGFSGEDITQWVKDHFNCTWEVSKRAETQKGFVVESKRWVVERTFAWIGKYRRLSKDYEFYENTSESFIYIALIRKMLKNLTAVNS
ncbi:IS5 family transposase [Phormidium tenue]|uniref:IS5 family transposase n=1 Tax=Phormidium tenue TaxID=126344 RepID=UPI002410EEEF